METQSLAFLGTLKKKLSYGSTRSILLNSLPGRSSTRLSLNDLDLIKDGLSIQFMDKLTTLHDFDLKFSIGYESIKTSDTPEVRAFKENRNDRLKKVERRLTNIKYDHDDIRKEQGIDTFGLGFPILVRRNPIDPSKVISAPVFIWHLDIVQSFDQAKAWKVSRKSETGIMVNEALRSYLLNEQHVDLPILPEEMTEDGLLEKHEIGKFLNDLEHRLNIQNIHDIDWSLEPLPDRINVEDETIGESRIIMSGVFGIYKSQKQSLIRDIENLIVIQSKKKKTTLKPVKWNKKTTPIEVDPSQHAVLRSLSELTNLVIQGPPGTGKSQTLTAIIASALSDKKKVLVVCEKRTALEVIYNNITKKYPFLEKAIALIEDVSADRNVIVRNMRAREEESNIFYFDYKAKAALENKITTYEQHITDSDEKYKSLSSRHIGNKKWEQMVSEWIKLNLDGSQVSELAWLSDKVEHPTDQTDITPLLAQIESSNRLYDRLSQRIDDYRILFNEHEITDVNIQLGLELNKRLYEWTALRESLEEYSKDFESVVKKKTQELFELYSHKCGSYREAYIYLKRMFRDPLHPSLLERILLMFSPQKKSVRTTSDQLRELASQINEYSSRFLCENLEDEVKQIIDTPLLSNDVNDRLIKYLYSRDNIRNGEVDSFYAQRWIEIESRFEQNKRQYLKIFRNIDQEDTDSRSLYEVCEKTQQRLSILCGEIDMIEDYRKWCQSWNSLDEKTRSFISISIKKGYDKWASLYYSAYLYRAMSQISTSNRFPGDDSHIDDIFNSKKEIDPNQELMMRMHISDWYAEGERKIRNSNLTFKKLYNLRGSGGESRNSLRKIVSFNLSSFTDFHPLILSNPTTVSSLFPTESGIFDIVIFDEASQLRIEETYSSLIRGKSIVVSGDSRQMPPSSYFESSRSNMDTNEEEGTPNDDSSFIEEMEIEMASKESLLEWAIDEGFTETYLDMHYRSRHPDLIEFSNVSFYNSRLIPMPASSSEKPIHFFQVNGQYDNRSNLDEANKIIEIIRNEISVDKSVGVATFNLNQRNLILDLIAKHRYEDPEFNAKITTLENNGFFVKNLENIQGDERDVIFISTTFGVKRNGTFAMMFGPIGQKNGHRLLNVIITRAKESVYIVTSIPENKQHEYRTFIMNDKKVTGKSGLLAYLLYCKYVSEGNDLQKNQLLDSIRQMIGERNTIIDTDANEGRSNFANEMYKILSYKYSTDRVFMNYRCGGFVIDIVVIDRQKNVKIAIECDGSAYIADEMNWHHDYYRKKQLEREGFVYRRLWSINWWKNSKQEEASLYHFIDGVINHDSHEMILPN